MVTRRPWTDADVAVVRARYAGERTADIARDLGRAVTSVYQLAARLGLAKSKWAVAEMARRAMADPGHGGRRTCIQPGAVPWNSGVPGSTGLHANSRKHHFVPGKLSGRAAQLVLPVGSYRITKDGLLERKVGERPGSSHLRWRSVCRLVWEAVHGPVPAGHLVVFKPGCSSTDPQRITLAVVELVTRAENMRRNSLHAKYPPEVARLVQLRGALTRQINRKAKEAARP